MGLHLPRPPWHLEPADQVYSTKASEKLSHIELYPEFSYGEYLDVMLWEIQSLLKQFPFLPLATERKYQHILWMDPAVKIWRP